MGSLPEIERGCKKKMLAKVLESITSVRLSCRIGRLLMQVKGLRIDSRLLIHSDPAYACHIHIVAFRVRRVDPRSFDLSTPCPLCGYRIRPAEILLTGWSLMRCPSCGRDFDSMAGKEAAFNFVTSGLQF